MDRRGGKTGKKATQRRAPAGLGFKAAKSFLENQQTIESFIHELGKGEEDLSKYSVGHVTSGVGASHFDVTLVPSGEKVPSAGILGYLKGGAPASGTFITRDSMVLVHDSRRGPMNRGRTHTILAVLSPYQTETILGMMGVAKQEEDDLFDRAIEEAVIQAEVAKAEANLAAMRRSMAATRKATPSNAASDTVSRKSSSSSVNLEAELGTEAAARRRTKKQAAFHRRKEAKKAAKAAAGGVGTWY
jgi:hypothetical protein